MRELQLLREREIALVSFDLDDPLLDTDGATEYRIRAAVKEAHRLAPGLATDAAEDALRQAMVANPVTDGTVVVFMGWMWRAR